MTRIEAFLIIVAATLALATVVMSAASVKVTNDIDQEVHNFHIRKCAEDDLCFSALLDGNHSGQENWSYTQNP